MAKDGVALAALTAAGAESGVIPTRELPTCVAEDTSNFISAHGAVGRVANDAVIIAVAVLDASAAHLPIALGACL